MDVLSIITFTMVAMTIVLIRTLKFEVNLLLIIIRLLDHVQELFLKMVISTIEIMYIFALIMFR